MEKTPTMSIKVVFSLSIMFKESCICSSLKEALTASHDFLRKVRSLDARPEASILARIVSNTAVQLARHSSIAVICSSSATLTNFGSNRLCWSWERATFNVYKAVARSLAASGALYRAEKLIKGFRSGTCQGYQACDTSSN